MLNRFSFFLDGESCRTHGMVCSGTGVWDAPERDVEVIEIPGRNGALTIDNGRWKNVTISYPILITPPFPQKSAEARAWLCSAPGYRRLEDERYPEVFRKARLRGGISFKPTEKLDAATATLTFDAMPQRFLKSGEDAVTFSASGSLYNPTRYEALPLIVVNGTGDGTLTVNGNTMTISDISSNVTLDSEICRAYKGTTPKDSTVEGSYPVLVAGANTITFTGDITSVVITPRWWTL